MQPKHSGSSCDEADDEAGQRHLSFHRHRENKRIPSRSRTSTPRTFRGSMSHLPSRISTPNTIVKSDVGFSLRRRQEKNPILAQHDNHPIPALPDNIKLIRQLEDKARVSRPSGLVLVTDDASSEFEREVSLENLRERKRRTVEWQKNIENIAPHRGNMVSPFRPPSASAISQHERCRSPGLSPLSQRLGTIHHKSMLSGERCTTLISYIRQVVYQHRSTILPQHVSSSLFELHAIQMRILEGGALATFVNYRAMMRKVWMFLKAHTSLNWDKDRLLSLLNQDVHNLVVMVQTVIDNPRDYHELIACRESDAQAILDLLQDILDSCCETRYSTNGFRKALLRLSQQSGLHPQCFTTQRIELTGDGPLKCGAFADVYKGRINSVVVAVKIVRVYQKDDKKAFVQKFLSEASVWRQLKHPNLLPFYGLYNMPDGRICLLSPWMTSGNLGDFIKTNPSADRLLLAHDVIHGVDFLHEEKIVHGDLKGLNILITPGQRACIADFGFASLVESQNRTFTGMSAITSKGGTAGWQAPEILAEGSDNTFESDIYALGIVLYELFSGLKPFEHLKNDYAITYQVVNNHARPERPQYLHITKSLSEKIWALMSSCWRHEASTRPSASEVVKVVHQFGERRCPAPQWNSSQFVEVRARLLEYPLSPSLQDIERLLL